MTTISISLSDAIGHINWQDFFAAWNIAPALAQIADIRGCGHCQAQWLSAPPQNVRTAASQAELMREEAREARDRLQRDLSTEFLRIDSTDIPEGTLLHAALNDEIETIAAKFDTVLPEKAKLYRTLADCLPKAAIEAAYNQLVPTAVTVEPVEQNGVNCTYMPITAKQQEYTADRHIIQQAEQLFPPRPLSELAIVSNRKLIYISHRK